MLLTLDPEKDCKTSTRKPSLVTHLLYVTHLSALFEGADATREGLFITAQRMVENLLKLGSTMGQRRMQNVFFKMVSGTSESTKMMLLECENPFLTLHGPRHAANSLEECLL